MQAFKAANPGCILADFIRWHSPKDWITDSAENGKLSSRMTEQGNLWTELWNSSEPIPAVYQKPLFDFSREMKSIIEYLDSITVQDLLDWIVPTILYMHFMKISTNDIFSSFPYFQNQAKKFSVEWARVDWKSVK